MDYSFFHVTLQGLGILGSIVGVGYHVIRLLRRIDKNFNVFQWEHNVMWYDWSRKNRVPPFPKVSHDLRGHGSESD